MDRSLNQTEVRRPRITPGDFKEGVKNIYSGIVLIIKGGGRGVGGSAIMITTP